MQIMRDDATSSSHHQRMESHHGERMSGPCSSAKSTQGALRRLCTLLCVLCTLAYSFKLPATNTRGRQPTQSHPSKLYLPHESSIYTPRSQQRRNDLTTLCMDKFYIESPNVTMNTSAETTPGENPGTMNSSTETTPEENPVAIIDSPNGTMNSSNETTLEENPVAITDSPNGTMNTSTETTPEENPVAIVDSPNATMKPSAETTPTEISAEKAERLAKARKEAEELRRRAKELLAEAKVMETSLRETRSTSKMTRMSESNDMIDKLFLNRPLTPEAVARKLREERWSIDQVIQVIERLHERQTRTLNFDRATVALTNPDFQIGDTRNAMVNATEIEIFDTYMTCLIQAASILDNEISSQDGMDRGNKRWPGRVALALKARLNELRRSEELSFRRRLAAGINDAMSTNTTMQDYMRRTLGLPTDAENVNKKDVNLTRVMERVAMVPLWVPSSLLSSMIASPALLDVKDIRTIKNNVLTKSNFFCTSSDSSPGAAIFRGNVRPPAVDPALAKGSQNQTAVIFSDIQRRLETEGLSDRIQLFFLQDPEWMPGQASLPKPVILALPKSVVPENASPRLSVRVLKRVSVGLSLLSSFGFSVACYALNPTFFESVVNQKDLAVLATCIPVFVGVLAVQAVHELAHYLVAKARGVKIGFPVPVPSTQLGSFGSITPLRSFPPNQAAMIDFALSGPVAAMSLSLVLLVIGIFQTVYASEVALSHFPVVPVSMLRSSFLSGSLLTFFAPKAMMLPLSQPIPIHPLFMVGFSGLISSALNLLPMFRLDGGRACSAALGNRIGGFASAGTLLFLLSLTLSGSSGLAFAWGIFVVFFQRRPEIPVRDEVTQIDDFRLGAWIASLATAILALVPFPGGPWFL